MEVSPLPEGPHGHRSGLRLWAHAPRRSQVSQAIPRVPGCFWWIPPEARVAVGAQWTPRCDRSGFAYSSDEAGTWWGGTPQRRGVRRSAGQCVLET